MAPQLSAAGFRTVWTPPANKGFAGGRYFGPHNLGKVGDSLVIWGRNLLDPVNGPGFDELRLDALKHV